MVENFLFSLFRCNVCNLRFKTVANLAAHSVAHVKDRPYKCQKCARSFSQVGNLEQHERSHGFRRTKVVECTVCGKTLRNPDNMKRHMYIHTGMTEFYWVLFTYLVGCCPISDLFGKGNQYGRSVS